MGGPVQMGVRTKDDVVYSAELYTSCISPFFDNDRFFNEDLEHIERFFVNAKEETTDKWTTHHLLAPNGYGLVFGDQKTKKIHSMQGYTSVGETFTTALTLAASGGVLTDPGSQDNFLEHIRVARAHASGYVPRRRLYDPARGQYTFVEMDDTPFEDIVAALVKAMYENRGKGMHIPPREDFIIDGGYEIITYNDNYWGAKKYLANLQADGIDFTADALNAWEEWFEDRKEYVLEDVGDDYEFENIPEHLFLEVYGSGYDEPYESRPPRI